MALETMVDCSCATMAPLWLEATRRAREGHLLTSGAEELPFEPSPALLNLGRSSLSKYRALAAWRHVALWQQRTEVGDPDFAFAMRGVYFTPCPDCTPFSWSRSAEDAPDVGAFDGPAEMKRWAAEGAAAVLASLEELLAKLRAGTSYEEEVLADLVKPATRRSLRDVLKLEKIRPHG